MAIKFSMCQILNITISVFIKIKLTNLKLNCKEKDFKTCLSIIRIKPWRK